MSDANFEPYRRGRAADCSARGRLMLGGLADDVPFEPPLGMLYSTDITPDVETGIGVWLSEEFSISMRKGTLPDGSHLYPVFLHTSYTLMPDEDIELLYEYLMRIPPARYEPPDNELQFPFNHRWLPVLWRWRQTQHH